jgi:hypothetical protein
VSARTIEVEGEEGPILLPARWCICGACDGDGTTSRHVEREGGGFTASEWADCEPDFRRAYMRGDFDRPCGACKGTGKVLEVDEDACNPEQHAALRAHDEARALDRALDEEAAAERRMGA